MQVKNTKNVNVDICILSNARLYIGIIDEKYYEHACCALTKKQAKKISRLCLKKRGEIIMKLYRVVTENIHFQGIVEYLKEHKLDATIIGGCYGLWQGQMEKSLVIEIVDGGGVQTRCDIERFAYWLKKYNGQDKVLVQAIEAEIPFL